MRCKFAYIIEACLFRQAVTKHQFSQFLRWKNTNLKEGDPWNTAYIPKFHNPAGQDESASNLEVPRKM
jgi:hypothetical protein